jgi:hypothetical protein
MSSGVRGIRSDKRLIKQEFKVYNIEQRYTCHKECRKIVENSLIILQELTPIWQLCFHFFQNVLFYVLSDDVEWVRSNLGNDTYYIGAEEPWEDELFLEEDRVGKFFIGNQSY